MCPPGENVSFGIDREGRERQAEALLDVLGQPGSCQFACAELRNASIM